MESPLRSLWLREALGDVPAAPPLAGGATADVVILGGGFVGLWTAIELKQRDPACDVVVLERDVCGGGASGRNGGMVLSWWPKLSSLVARCGPEEAVRLGRESAAAVDAIGAFCATHGIDADFRKGGFLWTATTPAHVGVWDGVLAACEAHGVEAFERLPADEVARRSSSPSGSTRGRRRCASRASGRSGSTRRAGPCGRRSSSSRRTRGRPSCPSSSGRSSSCRATSSPPRRSPTGWRRPAGPVTRASPTRR